MHPVQSGSMLKLLAQQLLWRFQLRKGINNIFSNRFGISGVPENQITSDKLYGAIFFLFFISVILLCPHVLQFFRRLPQGFFCVLQNINFFPLAWRWVDNDWILILGWTYPLRWLMLSIISKLLMNIAATRWHYWVTLLTLLYFSYCCSLCLSIRHHHIDVVETEASFKKRYSWMLAGHLELQSRPIITL